MPRAADAGGGSAKSLVGSPWPFDLDKRQALLKQQWRHSKSVEQLLGLSRFLRGMTLKSAFRQNHLKSVDVATLTGGPGSLTYACVGSAKHATMAVLSVSAGVYEDLHFKISVRLGQDRTIAGR